MKSYWWLNRAFKESTQVVIIGDCTYKNCGVFNSYKSKNCKIDIYVWDLFEKLIYIYAINVI